MITVKCAVTADIRRICEIISAMTPGLPHDYRDAERKFEKCILPKSDCFLWAAFDGNEVIGTAMMHFQHKLSYHCGIAAHLEDVVVDPAHRGKGAGKMLIETAIATAKGAGCYKIMLTASKSVPYYEKLGFVAHDTGMRMSLMENEHPN